MGTSVSANRHFESVWWLLWIVPCCLVADGFYLEWVFFVCLFVHYDRRRGIDTWIQHTLEQTTAQSTLIQNWLVMGFMSFRKNNKADVYSGLKRCPAVMWRNNIKGHLFSAGGVSAGSGCSIGRVRILSHR